MISEKEKKKSAIEMCWAEIFLKWFNDKYHFDYSVKSVRDTPGIDVNGMSRSGTYPPLKIELTEAKKLDKERLDEKNTGLIYDLVQVQNIITRKEKKYKGNVDIRETILLIQGYLSYDWMSGDAEELKQKNKNSPFRGIYYVYPGDTSRQPFVVDIKCVFE